VATSRKAAAECPTTLDWKREVTGDGRRKTTVNFTFVTGKPTWSEIEREVKGTVEELFYISFNGVIDDNPRIARPNGLVDGNSLHQL